MTAWQIDIFRFTESNTCWDVILEQQQLARCTHGWWENSQWSLSYNWLETDTLIHQPGGAGILCMNQVAHKTLKPGNNLMGLGWWYWTWIQGPHGFFLCIISMYCPCVLHGPTTTYQQHVRHLTNSNRFECPQDAILLDITKEIKSWQEEGDHIIVLTDFNKVVTDAMAHCWATNLGLVEAITWLHPQHPPQPFNEAADLLMASSWPPNYWHKWQLVIWVLVMQCQAIIALFGSTSTYQNFAQKYQRLCQTECS